MEAFHLLPDNCWMGRSNPVKTAITLDSDDLLLPLDPTLVHDGSRFGRGGKMVSGRGAGARVSNGEDSVDTGESSVFLCRRLGRDVLNVLIEDLDAAAAT